MPFWMTLSLWWEKKAEPWLARNWHWLAAVTGGLLLFIIAIAKKRPEVQVVSTELSKADRVKHDLEEKKAADEAKLVRELEEDLQRVNEKRDESVQGLVGNQQEVADRPPQGSDLTKYLESVGKDVRR